LQEWSDSAIVIWLAMIEFVDAAFAYLAPYLGLSKDHVKLVTLLYTAVPLCAVLKRLPDDKPYLKNLFNIAYARLSGRI
jgi:lysophospholipid acyltransferase